MTGGIGGAFALHTGLAGNLNSNAAMLDSTVSAIVDNKSGSVFISQDASTPLSLSGTAGGNLR